MKKLIISFFILFTLVFTGYSQAKFKPSLGFSLNDFAETETGDFKAKTGVQLGASVALGRKIYVEPGVYYVSKSSAFSYTSPSNITVATSPLMKGVRVPVAVGAGVLGNNKSALNLRVFGGTSAFFVTSVGEDLVKKNINSPAWGLFAGTGIDIGVLFTELSYEWSLTDASKAINNIDLGKSRTLFFTIGLKF